MARNSSRRDFLKVTGAAAATGMILAGGVHAAGDETIKVGVIGCGGRGSGGAENVLNAAKGVEIVALGDFVKGKAVNLRKRLVDFLNGEGKQTGNKVTATEDTCFGGLDNFEKVLSTGCNYVILATPPGFRPINLAAAVAAGKNVFTEKPVAVDGTGIRRVLDVYDEAMKKKLAIAAGTQRRHQAPYIETIKRLQDGAIGDIKGGRCHWNQNNIWFRPRDKHMSDLEYQVHNWYHFLWLCGDHIVEQHVHNLDVINWILAAHPTRCVGMGGRVMECKDPNVDGNIFNFFSVDLEYPNGVRVLSTCRQIKNCDNNVSESVVGTKGFCQVNAFTINGERVEQGGGVRRKDGDPYV